MAEWTEHYFECEVANELIMGPVCTCPPGWPKKRTPSTDHVDPWADVNAFLEEYWTVSKGSGVPMRTALIALIQAREEKVRASTTAFYNRRYRQKGKW